MYQLRISRMQSYDSLDSEARESDFWSITELPIFKKFTTGISHFEMLMKMEHYINRVDPNILKETFEDFDTYEQAWESLCSENVSTVPEIFIREFVSRHYSYDKDWIGTDQHATDDFDFEVIKFDGQYDD